MPNVAPTDLPEPLVWWHRRMVADALAGIGGSVAVTQHAVWPFPHSLSRRDIYALRDRDPAATAPLVAEFSRQPGPADVSIDVGGYHTGGTRDGHGIV